MQSGMKLSACMLLGSLAVSSVAHAEYSAESAVGQPAPELTVGKVWNSGVPSNEGLKGKALLLEFYDTR